MMSNTFSYETINDFEIRHCRCNSSICNEPNPDKMPFELRIRHDDPEIIQALKEKIKEWIGNE